MKTLFKQIGLVITFIFFSFSYAQISFDNEANTLGLASLVEILI